MDPVVRNPYYKFYYYWSEIETCVNHRIVSIPEFIEQKWKLRQSPKIWRLHRCECICFMNRTAVEKSLARLSPITIFTLSATITCAWDRRLLKMLILNHPLVCIFHKIWSRTIVFLLFNRFILFLDIFTH